MRWKTLAGVLVALAFLVPATPAAAQVESAGLDTSCQTVERKVYTDIRELVTIDLDTATDQQVRVLTSKILSKVRTDSLTTLDDQIVERLKGPAEELRSFLKTDMYQTWSSDLAIKIGQTLTDDAGPKVNEAAQEALDYGDVDAYLTYLNDGL